MGFHLYLSFSICSASLGTQSLSRFKSYKPTDPFITPPTSLQMRCSDTCDTCLVGERDSHFMWEVCHLDALFSYVSCMGEKHFKSPNSTTWTYPVALVVKNLPANAGDAKDVGSIPGSGRSPGGGNGTPTPVLLTGKLHGQRGLAGYSPWGRKEWDTNGHTSSTT